MNMVGGGCSRVNRGSRQYYGATRWMPPAPRKEFSWASVKIAALEILSGAAFLLAVIIWTQILGTWLG